MTPNARIYLLEDDPTRIIWLARHLTGEIQGSQTAERWNEFTGDYDLILLDHDLGGRQMQGVEGDWAGEDNGMTFLKRVMHKIKPESRVVVHSYNIPAANRMYALLKDVGHPNLHLAQFHTFRFYEAIKPWTPKVHIF